MGDVAAAGLCRRFGNAADVLCLQLLILFVDLLLPFLEPRRNDDRNAWAALSELLGHGEDQVVLNVPVLLEWAVFAELPLLEKLFEQHVLLMHRWHFVA